MSEHPMTPLKEESPEPMSLPFSRMDLDIPQGTMTPPPKCSVPQSVKSVSSHVTSKCSKCSGATCKGMEYICVRCTNQNTAECNRLKKVMDDRQKRQFARNNVNNYANEVTSIYIYDIYIYIYLHYIYIYIYIGETKTCKTLGSSCEKNERNQKSYSRN